MSAAKKVIPPSPGRLGKMPKPEKAEQIVGKPWPERIDLIKGLWRKAGASVAFPDDKQLFWLTLEISACAAHAGDEGEQQRNKEARAAIQFLRGWAPEGLTILTKSLDLAEQLAAAPPDPTRAWVHRARALWAQVNGILESRGDKSGRTATSHAIKFVSLSLREVGHPAATPDAVSMEIRKS